jgi:hypothetical protein
MDSKTRHGTILKQKNCTYQDGWHRIELCPHRPPAFCRTRVWLPCPLAHTPEEVRLAGTKRGGRPIHSTLALTEHKEKICMLMRVFCKKVVTFPAKIRQKINKNQQRKDYLNVNKTE